MKYLYTVLFLASFAPMNGQVTFLTEPDFPPGIWVLADVSASAGIAVGSETGTNSELYILDLSTNTIDIIESTPVDEVPLHVPQIHTSNDGSIFATTLPNGNGEYLVATYERATGTWTTIGTLNPDFTTLPFNISGDGSTIVGWARISESEAYPFTWTEQDGFTLFDQQGVLRASSMTGDIVGGHITNDQGEAQAAFWNANREITVLEFPSGENPGPIFAISDDGQWMGGGPSKETGLPWIWNATTGLTFMEPPSGETDLGRVTAISATGKTILGTYWDSDPPSSGNSTRLGFIYTAEVGQRFLNEFVVDEGFDPAPFSLAGSNAISEDASIIVGAAFDPVFFTSFFLDVGNVLGVDDLDANPITYYPNPVKDILHFQTNEPIDTVIIFDLTGKVIRSQTRLELQNALDISSLSTGMYIIELVVGGQKTHIKILKK
jgi:hypothetical protein